MHIAVIGLNHNTAPAEVRDKVAFTDFKKIEAINNLLDIGINEVIILSTCNRSEIYIVDYKNNISQYIEEVGILYKKIFYIDSVESFLYIKKDEEAIYHIYNVATGLDSIVIGEDQILGQVKEAHEFSMDVGGSRKILNKLFREAVSTAKNIKATLKISAYPLSISYIGVKFIMEKIGTYKDKNILIIGLGKMGRLALQYIVEEGCKKVYIVNRSHNKIVDISKEYPDVIGINYSDRYEIIKDVDVIITATASPHTIIRADKIKKRYKELYIMDMAMPRDVDVNVNSLKNVYLYNVDDLKNIAENNEKKREKLSKRATEFIREGTQEFQLWLNSIVADPIIKSLKDKCDVIERDTLDYIYRKIELDNRHRKIVSKMLKSALMRLIREPILKLKSMDSEEKRELYISTLEELFDISVVEKQKFTINKFL